MKYVLVRKSDGSMASSVRINDNHEVVAAKFYFMGRKQINEKRFDELWRVIPESEYDLMVEAYERRSSSDPNKRWWKTENEYLDIDR